VQSGHYACPDLKPFKQLSDEVEKGNFQRAAKMRFPPSCVWLEKGDTLFGPPLEESEYHSSKFLKMKLRDGSDVWVEKYKEYED
jgi:hypothetical protein